MKPRIFKSVVLQGYWGVEHIHAFIQYFYSWKRALLAVEEFYKWKENEYKVRSEP